MNGCGWSELSVVAVCFPLIVVWALVNFPVILPGTEQIGSSVSLRSVHRLCPVSTPDKGKVVIRILEGTSYPKQVNTAL